MRLHKNPELFRSLVEETAQRIPLSELYVEKDYWITQSLEYLANSKYANDVVFKGGTSLSKVYKLIKRFSEDIDLAVVPTDSTSEHVQKHKMKDIERILTTDLTYVEDERESKGSKFRRTAYTYQRAIDGNDFGHGSPRLLVEINRFSNPEPYETMHLQSFIAEMLIDKNRHDLINEYELHQFPLKILSVERTLMEKIIRLVKNSYKKEPVEELKKDIRHLYDICIILQCKEQRGFIQTDDFQQLFAQCIIDEKNTGHDSSAKLDKPPTDSPLFHSFSDWRNALEKTYQVGFADFVYGKPLPHMDEIEETLSFLKQHLK